MSELPSPSDFPLRHLHLQDLHEAAGARFGPFAGWYMPITYPAGVMKEHLHTREAAGLFDISHMKLFEVAGAQAAEALARACPIDANALDIGRSKYTLLLAEDAGILDDLIVTRLGPERFIVVANAGNAEADGVRLAAMAEGLACTVTGLDRVFLALQGPAAEAVLTDAGFDVADLVFMSAIEPQEDWFLARSGYTGEDGFEIAMPPEAAKAFAEKLLLDNRVAWTGLAARDSLRLEAGLCLHGQDIDPSTDPASAGLLWAIPKPLRENGAFAGADALRAIIAKGPGRKRVGLKPEGRQPVRAGEAILDDEGTVVGRVTSGGFGPSVGHPVAMGYVDVGKSDAALHVELRGRPVPLAVHKLPFTPHRYRKG